MEFKEFIKTISDEEPPEIFNSYLKALWLDKKEEWEKAHSIVIVLSDSKADWIHAYLHRKEGDNDNASYWYRKANKSKPNISSDEEWNQLVNYFLGDH